MNDISLKERIYRYFQNRPGQVISSGAIQRLVAANTKDTPRSAVRRMQELAEDKLLERKLIKGHTHYVLAGQQTPKTTNPKPAQSKQQIAEENIKHWSKYSKV